MKNAPTPVPGGQVAAAGMARSPRSDRALASVLPKVKGVPFWAAILVLVVTTSIGAIIDSSSATDRLSSGVRIGFLIGAVLSVLIVQRRAVFTAMVQPPIVYLAVAVVATLSLQNGKLIDRLFPVVDIFPTMVIGTAIAVVLGLIRILAQPLRRTNNGSPTRTAHA